MRAAGVGHQPFDMRSPELDLRSFDLRAGTSDEQILRNIY